MCVSVQRKIICVCLFFFFSSYAWSIEGSRPFPLNYFATFILVGLVVGGLGVFSLWFPISLNAPLLSTTTEELELKALSPSSSSSSDDSSSSSSEMSELEN